jgi:hypothetical protein
MQHLDLPVSQNCQIIVHAVLESLRSSETAKEILASAQNLSSSEREAVDYLNGQFSKVHLNAGKETVRNRMRLVGGNLPANNANKKSPISIFTRKPIQGSVFPIGSHALGLDEALMWTKVNPFSPLNDGSLINPY